LIEAKEAAGAGPDGDQAPRPHNEVELQHRASPVGEADSFAAERPPQRSEGGRAQQILAPVLLVSPPREP